MTRPNMIMLAVSLVLFACLVQTSSARSLLQGFTCSGAIPQCEPNRCYLQTVAGKMQNVCERCMPGYNTTQDGLNCGEFRSLYLAAAAWRGHGRSGEYNLGPCVHAYCFCSPMAQPSLLEK
jgi:hypothetical protein